ncbi:hypothetical protein Droror1_Dr00012486 [Drosera rotundifolia]
MHKVKTLKPTKGIVKKTEGTVQRKDCPKETKKHQECQKILEAARLKLQDIQKRQERQKMREAARLKLQKMEELADYVDDMAVMNDFLILTGNNSFRYTENSRDNYRFWNRKRHSIKKEKANLAEYKTASQFLAHPQSAATFTGQRRRYLHHSPQRVAALAAAFAPYGQSCRRLGRRSS